MTQLTDQQLVSVAKAAGFSGAALTMAVAVALAESGGRTDAVGRNAGSVDRGLWQINSKYHPEVSATQAFSPAGNAAAAYRISSGGSNWQPWSTYNNGSAQRMKARASRAVGRTGLTGTADTAQVENTATNAVFGSDRKTLTPAEIAKLSPEERKGYEAYLSTTEGWMNDGPFDFVTNPIGDVKDFLNVATKFVVRAYQWISNPHNWVRLFTVLGGGAAILVGLKMLADSGAAGGAAKGASNVVDSATNVAKVVALKRAPAAA